MVATGVGIIVSGLAYCYLRTGTLLVAKNVTMNLSNNSLRRSIDQISDRLQGAINVPVLIDTSGVATTSPSAGIFYDRLLGEPYIVTHPGGAGLAASATSVTITRSVNPYASPPLPSVGDVLLIDGAPATSRPLVSSITAAPVSGSLQAITVNFANAIGSAISWDAAQPKTSNLIRREALIVTPTTGARPQLRRYPSFETTTDLTDATKFVVLSREVGNVGDEITPFSIVNAGLDRLVNIDFRVRATGFDTVMLNKEINSFSSYMRVQSMIPSRERPRN